MKKLTRENPRGIMDQAMNPETQGHTERQPTEASDISGLLEEAVERGARAALRWARLQRDNDLLKMNQAGPRSRNEAGSVGSNRAPSPARSRPGIMLKIHELNYYKRSSGNYASNSFMRFLA
ncbi:hypothetical protein Salat_1174600 [Sesamum alatum]|uniref:Uncharacterized protein n=1 Tax=Sesamum alatum TaxID=300844 RepID=A0AAE2CNK8_9LAMI|nr:hypothetical protein Salat_1174600 [Sesamum alatum]